LTRGKLVKHLKADATALLEAAREVMEVHGCGLPPGDCNSCRDLRMAIWQAEGDKESGGVRIVERVQ
jgi:hypothetical protein